VKFKIAVGAEIIVIFISIYSQVHGNYVYLQYHLPYEDFMWKKWAIVSEEEIMCDGADYVYLSPCDLPVPNLQTSPMKRMTA
jgi:hypothetical protein